MQQPCPRLQVYIILETLLSPTIDHTPNRLVEAIGARAHACLEVPHAAQQGLGLGLEAPHAGQQGLGLALHDVCMALHDVCMALHALGLGLALHTPPRAGATYTQGWMWLRLPRPVAVPHAELPLLA